MVLAKAKAQVLNTYSSSLSLTNIMDAIFGWKPGRIIFVVAANLLSLLFLYGEIISWFKSFLVTLSVLAISFSGIMIADYFIVRRWLVYEKALSGHNQQVNRAGVITIVSAFILSHFVSNTIIPVEFVTAIIVSLSLYLLLRIYWRQG